LISPASELKKGILAPNINNTPTIIIAAPKIMKVLPNENKVSSLLLINENL